MDAVASQAQTDVSWEAVSERVTSEIERTSEEWVTGRVASEVGRVTQTRSNASPATSIDQARVTQEELSRVEAKTNTSLKALGHFSYVFLSCVVATLTLPLGSLRC